MADDLPPGWSFDPPELPEGWSFAPPKQQRATLKGHPTDALGAAKRFGDQLSIIEPIKRAYQGAEALTTGQIDPLSNEGVAAAADIASVLTPGSIVRGGGRSIAMTRGMAEPTQREILNATAGRVGVDIPRMLTSDTANKLAIGMSKIPLVGAGVRRSASKFGRDVSDTLKDVVEEQSGGRPISAEEAGQVIKAPKEGKLEGDLSPFEEFSPKHFALIRDASTPEAALEQVKGWAMSRRGEDQAALLNLRHSTPSADWESVRSNIVQNIVKDAEGDFSNDAFVQNYGKITQAGKNILFRGPEGASLLRSLEDLYTISKGANFKRLATKPEGGDLLKGIAAGGVAGAIASGAISQATSALSGGFMAPLSALGSVLGASTLSKYLTRPETASAIARWGRKYSAFTKARDIGQLSLLRGASDELAKNLDDSNITGEDILNAIKSTAP